MFDIFRNEPEIRTYESGEFLFEQGEAAVHHRTNLES